MKILGTGLGGLVGSRIAELLSSKYSFENISRSAGIDISNAEEVDKAVRSSDALIVVHLAAKTDVDACEKDKARGEEGEAWKINVAGTENVSRAASQTNKKVIYISTDFVFDGEKQEAYNEDDQPDPINWYGQTKYEGEKIVQSLTTPYLLVRIAYPYRAVFSKLDFVRAIKKRLDERQEVHAITDHLFCPTFIDDIAHGLDRLIEENNTGIYHLVGSQTLTPYDAALLIAEKFKLDSSLIRQTTRAVYFQNRAQRPFNLSLGNDKIKALGIDMKAFREGLEEVKNT